MQMTEFLNKHNLLNDLQSGFRKQRGCVTALLKISNDIRKEIDAGRSTFLVLLDFSKAFDSVNHRLLLEKLQKKFYFDSTAVKLIQSYLTDRHQIVCCNNNMSLPLHVSVGVPQGSILGPLLFSMFVNDIMDVISYSNYHMYADDLQIYFSDDLISRIIDCINFDLFSIYQWALKNKLLLNSSKSVSIVISRNEVNTNTLPSITLNGSPLPYKDTVKNLGIIFNRNLSWNCHIDSVVAKIYGVLRKLTLSAHFTPVQTRCMLVKSLVVPIITYGCELFACLDSTSFKKLEGSYHAAVRYAFGLRKYDHISDFKNLILGCNLETFLNFRILCFLHKIMITKSPQYLNDELTFSRSVRSCTITPVCCKYMITERQFFPYAIAKWNALPLNLRRQWSCTDFKNSLFNYLKEV